VTLGLGQRGAVVTTALLFLASFPIYATERCRLTFSSGAAIEAGVARTAAVQAQGLSGTTGNLLFAWSNAEPRVFWMKDTPAPLDVAFIDAGGNVFDIQHMLVNKPDTALPAYYFSVDPAKYALELPAGEFTRMGINVGDQLAQLDCAEAEPETAD
jgi:uncharacterized membrane protein (UPF0127 family)